jgi:hypothetical protein
MHNISMLCLSFMLPIIIIAGTCMTDLDYRLGNSKYSDSSITDEESFHGPNSAKLSVAKEGNYVRATIYMDKPMSLEDLDSLNMRINPLSGDGKIQIEIYLDGDGDSSYDSKSPRDARLLTDEMSFSEMGIRPDQWSEIDGSGLSYKKYKDKSFGGKNLDECRNQLGDRMVVKIYITIYKDPSVDKTTAYLDYLNIGDQIISFEPFEKDELKKAPKSISPGSQITYTITYGNNFLEPLDVVIREIYDSRTVFVSADPLPDAGTNNVWTIRDLPPGVHGQIKIKVRTIKIYCKADIDSKVSGEGFASSRGLLSTDLSSYAVTNRVFVSSDKFDLTASASTAIKPVQGSIIAFREHGSGLYSSEEQLGYSASRIFVFRDTNASKSQITTNTSSALLSGLFTSDWYASSLCENKVGDMMLSESYDEGKYLDLNSRAYLGKTSSYFETASNFSGAAEHTSRWQGIVRSERLLGNFTTTSNARAKSDSSRVRTTDDVLECCPDDLQ